MRHFFSYSGGVTAEPPKQMLVKLKSLLLKGEVKKTQAKSLKVNYCVRIESRSAVSTNALSCIPSSITRKCLDDTTPAIHI